MELGAKDPKTGAVKIAHVQQWARAVRKLWITDYLTILLKVIVGMSEDNANNSGRGTDAIIFIDDYYD